MQPGNYISLWRVAKSDRGNFYEVSVSCQKKNKATDKYETNFRDGFVHFVGKAADTVAPYDGQESDSKPIVRGKVGAFDVSNFYTDKDGKGKFTKNPHYTIFEFEATDSNESNVTNIAKQPKPKIDFVNIPDSVTEEDLPFN